MCVCVCVCVCEFYLYASFKQPLPHENDRKQNHFDAEYRLFDFCFS